MASPRANAQPPRRINLTDNRHPVSVDIATIVRIPSTKKKNRLMEPVLRRIKYCSAEVQSNLLRNSTLVSRPTFYVGISRSHDFVQFRVNIHIFGSLETGNSFAGISFNIGNSINFGESSSYRAFTAASGHAWKFQGHQLNVFISWSGRRGLFSRFRSWCCGVSGWFISGWRRRKWFRRVCVIAADGNRQQGNRRQSK